MQKNVQWRQRRTFVVAGGMFAAFIGADARQVRWLCARLTCVCFGGGYDVKGQGETVVKTETRVPLCGQGVLPVFSSKLIIQGSTWCGLYPTVSMSASGRRRPAHGHVMRGQSG